jgi:hypothetical protein
LGLPTENVANALEAMNEDSQQGIFGIPGDGSKLVLDSTWPKVDKMLKEYGIPVWSDMSFDAYKKVMELSK